MRKKIVWKLAASFGALLRLFSVVLGAVFLSLFRQHTIALNRASMEERAVSIAATMAGFQSGGRGMGHGGYGAYLRFLDELAMADVWIVNEKLAVLTMGHGHSTTSYEALPDNAEEIVQRVFAGELTYGEEFSPLMDNPTLTVGAPIFSDGVVVGAVLLHSPVSGIDAAVRQGLVTLSAGMATALLLAGGAAVLLSYLLTRPLRRMEQTALRLAEGDYTARTGVTQQDEVGQLAQTLDRLSGQLAQVEEERTALDQLKQDFVMNVSHELRTPVAVLRGSLEVLQDGTVHQPEEVADYYRQMLAESRHLERLVNDLLDLSRLQDDRFRLELGEVNLCDVVRDGARAIRRTAMGRGIELTVNCPEEECPVWGDYGRIRQMLIILLDNAVKFSPDGGRVSLELTRQPEGLRLSVTDHGGGIPPEELPHIFDRFRKTRDSRNQSGTGLGLAIAQQIAQRHSARLSVESGAGRTCFTICFPMIEGLN